MRRPARLSMCAVVTVALLVCYASGLWKDAGPTKASAVGGEPYAIRLLFVWIVCTRIVLASRSACGRCYRSYLAMRSRSGWRWVSRRTAAVLVLRWCPAGTEEQAIRILEMNEQ
ncbi:hypothetical protein H4582DRAFT_1983136 [Lactarius indigo]|nr:hypothetical protein H4582DRAFT_1983136 [Lactarius indigo]